MSKKLITKDQVAGLILAGGTGRRVSNQDKGLLEYRGRKLIERQIVWLQPQVSELLISANRNISYYKDFGFPVVRDDIDVFLGPLQGVCKGLENSSKDWMFVQPVDMPSLPTSTLQLFLEKINTLPTREQSNCYYCSSDKRKHYLSMLIAKSKQVELRQFLQDNGKKVRDFHRLIDSVSLDLGLGESHFVNLNRPSDYD